MRSPIRILLSFFILTTVLPLKVTAEQGSPDIYIVPSVAYHILDDEGNIDDLASIGLNLGYQLNERWALETGVRIGNTETRFADNADMYSLQLDGLYSFQEHGAWQPYIVGSLMNLSFDVDKIRHEVQTGLGAGSYYRLTDSVRLSGDARALYSHTDNLFDNAVTLGVQFSFGSGQSTAKVATITKPHLYSFEVHFDTAQAVLLPEYIDHVDSLVSILKHNPNSRITIEGDTDNTGSVSFNLHLSEDRAKAVKVMLVTQHGIHENRIIIKALGETHPVAENITPGGRAKNRRAVVKVNIIHE